MATALANSRKTSAKPRMAVYALTHQGLAVALRVARDFDADVFAGVSLQERLGDSKSAADLPVKKSTESARTHDNIQWFARLAAQVEQVFAKYDCHIFVAATGIVVRTLAPLVTAKTVDPAVLVIDQQGTFVISLLSGHLGGANAFARTVATALGATPVITTATDVKGLPAIDLLAQQHGLVIGNISAATAVNATLVAGTPVKVYDPENYLALRGSPWEHFFCFVDAVPAHEVADACDANTVPTVLVTEKNIAGHARLLVLHPPVLCVGIGCKRDTSAAAIEQHVREVFAQHGLSLTAIACVASATLKEDEPGLAQAARTFGVPVRFFTPQELQNFPVSSPSPKAQEVLGLQGVCEPAALAAAQERAKHAALIVPKCVAPSITLAIAKSCME